ncbi:LEAF RUST 10 DISEASE-RESISTANCE LOCUS RECEPTOR-LIKE PROTEIN KINASE-like 1.2 [Quillaja saponaria]|uniref:LEAF RUST 10 DISEASE-RESISTANCE LOCUS RECEPTOR-LIKE PROTEIN KINASE-like 1.2 n=1 Tax=Quillaja saponaria TaxID=32244 RepID=A0AAD7L9K3_QUISA|nr:LEAF RUST 10 DISEASE-RESISTANCE LOCUS RECEPTOR-LIKE PROTEIN KINASE-like 1.2 [Quillaja saponaria]
MLLGMNYFIRNLCRSKYKIGCPNEKETGTVLGLYGEGSNLRYAYKKCKGGVDDIEEVGEALRRGFVPEWIASDYSVCKESGGGCGFDTKMYHFKRYCPDRPHAWHCHSV